MLDTSPHPHTEPYLRGGHSPMPWSEAARQLATADRIWLATTTPGGAPHMVPLLTVWTMGTPHFVASPSSRKARNLAANPRCVISTSADGFDLVVEGTATPVSEPERLRAVADAYAEQHDWAVQIRDGAFHAEGAPTAGPPPYHVYAIAPRVAFAFPTDGRHAPTRWTFPAAG